MRGARVERDGATAHVDWLRTEDDRGARRSFAS